MWIDLIPEGQLQKKFDCESRQWVKCNQSCHDRDNGDIGKDAFSAK